MDERRGREEGGAVVEQRPCGGRACSHIVDEVAGDSAVVGYGECGGASGLVSEEGVGGERQVAGRAVVEDAGRAFGLCAVVACSDDVAPRGADAVEEILVGSAVGGAFLCREVERRGRSVPSDREAVVGDSLYLEVDVGVGVGGGVDVEVDDFVVFEVEYKASECRSVRSGDKLGVRGHGGDHESVMVGVRQFGDAVLGDCSVKRNDYRSDRK